jgi:hypothetical protein
VPKVEANSARGRASEQRDGKCRIPRELSTVLAPGHLSQPGGGGSREVPPRHSRPYAPLSHPFVERLIGTIRRECLDRTLFWTAADLELKLLEFQRTSTVIAPAQGWAG